ncbi:lysophospholipid acyltransferase family protein [Altererythrobacter lauratis]|uniref:Lysophospholipid acyltransferase family protein n=1 Tax=Alteraurantiacibacter lauratis TaxID=2054627 RepID=A0ABV7EFD5_9SPHN
MLVIRNILFYIAFYGGSVFFVIKAVLSQHNRARLRRTCDAWSRWHRRCAGRLLGIRVAVEGQMLPGAALYVMKHESFFEAIDMPHLFDFPAPFGKKELFAIPGWGRAAEIYGGIEVARDEGAKTLRKMLKQARERIAEGRPMVLFPEGTRVPHGTRPPLKSGFAALYKMLGVPVVPVAVNSGPLYHRRWKVPGTITYRIGQPIPAGLPREEAEALVLDAINQLNAPAPPLA